MMELRLGVEIESAGLAAERASRAQVRAIGAALEAIERAAAQGKAAVDEDLALAPRHRRGHRQPASSPRFLQFIGRHLIPRRTVSGLPERMGGQRAYLALHPGGAPPHLRGDPRAATPTAAREAMRRHLTRSLDRYRKLAAERRKRRVKILLTHSPEALANYYGERALAGLRQPGR